MFGRGPSSGARNARIEIIDPREVLGCGNPRSDGQVVRQPLSNTSRSRCVAHCGPTTPRILRSLGRSDITAAPCRVLFAAIWTDLGLGVGLGGLPCGASDIQMTPITCLHLPLPPGGSGLIYFKQRSSFIHCSWTSEQAGAQRAALLVPRWTLLLTRSRSSFAIGKQKSVGDAVTGSSIAHVAYLFQFDQS